MKYHRNSPAILALAAALLIATGGIANAAEGIFVPPPRGAGETLDPEVDEKEDKTPETIKTIEGDVIKGKVLSFADDGRLLFKGPQFAGEMAIFAKSLDSIALKNSKEETGKDHVGLTNGDRIYGELAAITPEYVVIDSEVAGPIRIPRRLVCSVGFTGGRKTLIDSDFASGKMDPWKVREGSWNASGGMLSSHSHGSGSAVYAELDQNEAVTIVADIRSTSGYGIRSYLAVFADTTDGYCGRNSVFAMLQSSEYYIGYCRNGSTNHITSRSLGRSVQTGVMRLAYDPKTSKAHFWLNAVDYGEFDVPHKIKKGKYVVFVSRYPSQTASLKVLRGIVPPTEDKSRDADETSHIIEFANGDRVSAAALALADGEFAIKTEFGGLTPSIDKIKMIHFAKLGREEPRRRKGDVRIETSMSRLTLQLTELTAEHLSGKSECYGDVKLSRDVIKNIKFNIYR